MWISIKCFQQIPIHSFDCASRWNKTTIQHCIALKITSRMKSAKELGFLAFFPSNFDFTLNDFIRD